MWVQSKQTRFVRTHLKVPVNDVLLVAVLHRRYDLQREERRPAHLRLIKEGVESEIPSATFCNSLAAILLPVATFLLLLVTALLSF